MLKLSTQVSLKEALTLGTFFEVHLEKSDPRLETRAFLRHRPVLYTRPLRDWTAGDEPVLIFPESPGSYSVDIEWRLDEQSGWESLRFSVEGGAGEIAKPTKIQIAGGDLWAPSAWEAEVFKESERSVKTQIDRLVRRKDVVYDLGANVGFYASLMARATGPKGKVLCVEANPICIQMLRTNVLTQGLEHVDILPVAMLHHQGASRFTLNYGNSNLGISEASGFYPHKTGHEITVPCFTFDGLVESFGLQPPDVIKIDVEGVEARVLEGMRKTLTEHRPRLLLELHGEVCAAESLACLAPFKYRYNDPMTGGKVDAEEAAQREEVFQLVATPAV